MKASAWRSKMSVLAVVAVAAWSGGAATAAQYIEPGTPAASPEVVSGGSWDTLATALTGGSTSSTTASIVGDSYILPSSGAEVVVADGVTVSASEDGEVEDQLIIETDDGIGAIGVLQTAGRPQAVMDLYVSGFAESMDDVMEVDIQATADIATGVYRVEATGTTFYMYISVDARPIPDFMLIEVMIADAADMEASIVQMRDNVSINGVAAFADVDEADVAGIIRTDEE